MREYYLNSVGPFPEKTPLNVTEYGTVDCGDYTLTRITYESLPGYLVTANLYRPNDQQPPCPLMLCTTGHWWGRNGELDGKGYPHVQERSAQLARMGYIVLAFDPFGQGERKLLFDPNSAVQSRMGQATHQHIALNLQLHLTGRNMTHYFIWDCIRGIDVLCGVEGADPTRIAVTGSSGGGSQTQYIAGADPRVTAAIPVCANWFYGTVPHSGKGNLDGEQNIPGRIRYGFELSDLIMMNNVNDALLLNASGDRDILKTSVDMYNDIQRVYARLYPEKGRSISYHLIGSGHSYNREFRETMYNWLNQKFGKYDEKAMETPVVIRGAEAINITRSGSVEELGSESLLTLLPQYVKEIAPELPDIGNKADHQAFLQTLQHQVRSVLKLSPVGPIIPSRTVETVRGKGFTLEKFALQSEDGLWIPAVLLTPDEPKGRTVVYVHERGKVNGVGNIIALAKSGRRVFAVDARGFREEPDPHPGQTARDDSPSFKGYQIIYGREDNEADFNAFAYEMEKPLFGMRLHDLMTGIAFLRDRDGSAKSLDIYGHGDGAMLALHAAVLDENIRTLVLDRMPVSFAELAVKPYGAQSPFLFIHNVLARYDTPQLLAAIAPRQVILANTVDAKRNVADQAMIARTFDYDKKVYQRLGAAKMLQINNIDEQVIITEYYH